MDYFHLLLQASHCISITSHVKMGSPNQGLGLILVLKKWGSEIDPRINNVLLWDGSLRILGLVPEPHFFTPGLIPEAQILSSSI